MKGADLIDFDLFVHVLVPYASGLFMRGLDYGERQENIDVIRYLRDKNTILTDNTGFFSNHTLAKDLGHRSWCRMDLI